jgi:ABC-2 type transport system permease protein
MASAGLAERPADVSGSGDQRRQLEHRRYGNGLCAVDHRERIGHLRAEGADADAGGGVVVLLEPRVWYNPELKSTLFLVPGLLAYIAMITAVVSTALSVVREKERGTIEQVRWPHRHAALYRRQEPAVFRDLLHRGARCGPGVDGPVRAADPGSVHLLLLSLGLFLAGALGMGLFISAISDSQQVAFQIAMLSSFLPTIMLSGSFTRFRACRSRCSW